MSSIATALDGLEHLARSMAAPAHLEFRRFTQARSGGGNHSEAIVLDITVAGGDRELRCRLLSGLLDHLAEHPDLEVRDRVTVEVG